MKLVNCSMDAHCFSVEVRLLSEILKMRKRMRQEEEDLLLRYPQVRCI